MPAEPAHEQAAREQRLRDEPTPPAPFLDSPERPLFSESRRRVPAGQPAVTAPAAATTSGTASGATTSTGTHGGSGGNGPEYWPFERDAEPPPPTEDHHEGRGWLRTAVVVGLLLLTVLAVVVAFSLGRGGSLPIVGDSGGDDQPSASASASASAQPLRITAVTDVDPPPGNGEENAGTVGNVVDGDPSTSWTTVTYYNRPDLGGLKSGVGLMLDLGSDQQVGSLAVQFGQPGTSFAVYAAPEGVTAAPSGPDAMQQVASASDAGDRANVQLEGAPTTRFVLLWLTSLPAVADGYQGQVAEVQLRS